MPSNLVDVQFLSAFFAVDERTIQLWAKTWIIKYGMVKAERGKYDFLKAVRCRIKDLEEKIEELEKGDVTLYKLKQEYQSMANEEKAIRLKMLTEEVIDAEAVRIAWLSETKTFSKSLMGLIPRLNVKLNGNDKTYKIIKDEVNAVRKEIGNSKLDIGDVKLTEILSAAEPNTETQTSTKPESNKKPGKKNKKSNKAIDDNLNKKSYSRKPSKNNT